MSEADDCNGELWSVILYSSKATISSAITLCRGELKSTAKLGHVRGVPRLFLLCDMIVGATRGSFDREFLDRVIEEFCSYAPLDDNEKRLFPAMLVFCLCGLLECVASSGMDHAALYSKGVSDGAERRADLDMLMSVDYVCGLNDSAKDDIATARLFDDNGVSVPDAIEARRVGLAELASTVGSIASALSNIVKNAGQDCERFYDFGAVFFGGETMRIENVMNNSRIVVYTDNRGSIEISSAQTSASVSVALKISVNGKIITLSDTDGVFQCYRTVYRAFTDNAEAAVEFIAPPTDGCCAVKLSVINRTPQNAFVSATMSCCMAANGYTEIDTKRVKNVGMVFIADNCEIGLCSDAPCEYGVSTDGNQKMMFAERNADICAFGVATAIFSVVADKKINAVRLSQFEDSMYFTRAVTACKAYYSDKYKYCDVECDVSRFVMREKATDTYATAEDSVGYVYERGVGGFTDNGYCTAVGNVRQGSLYDMLFDGELFVEALDSGDSVTVADDGSEFYSLNVVLCENDIVWSPFGEPAGEGATCELCRGYIVYKSVRNGCVVTLTRTLARGKRAEVLLLAVENRTNDKRNIDVMFTSHADAAARVVENADKIYALGSNGFVLFSSETPTEFCKYREGYLDHGRIARASHFVSGGETLAPTLSVALELSPRTVKKVAFCRAALSGGTTLDGITVDAAEQYISAEREYYLRCGFVALISSDPALNAVYSASLYFAYAHLHKYLRDGRYDRALLTCFAVKYADPDFVCDTLLMLCEKQEACGRLDVGHKTSIATLLLPLAVIDFINFCGDCRLFGENVSFCGIDGIATKAASVLEHCFRAIDFSILISTRIDEKTDKAFSVLLLRAVRAFLEYSANSERVKAYSSVAARLSLSAESCHALVAAEIEFDPLGIATAYARYEADDNEFAYKAVKELTDKALQDVNGLPRLFSSPDGVTAALFYTLVTEKLLGISVRGDRAKISPNTASNAPHLEFCISSDDGNETHVLIDDGEALGGWQINLDRISIASDTIKISEVGERIVMRRSGVAS